MKSNIVAKGTCLEVLTKLVDSYQDKEVDYNDDIEIWVHAQDPTDSWGYPPH